MTTPRPYTPPDVRSAPERSPIPFRPWMALLPGESKSEQIDRLHRTCFYCGREHDTVAETDEHELACGG